MIEDPADERLNGTSKSEDDHEDEEVSTNSDTTCSLIGEFGRWQFCISVAMGLLKLSVAWFQLGIVFLAPPQQFWCKKPDLFHNYTDQYWRNISKPVLSKDYCNIYDPEKLINNLGNQINIPIIPCTEFEYDISLFTSTIITEWNLVCSRKYYVELSQTSLMFGVLIGNILIGLLSDAYGRRKMLLLSIVVQAAAGIASALTPWLIGFIIARFVLAMASGGLAIVSFVICMEVVGGVWRIIIPVVYQIPFGIGNSLMAGIAYLLLDWRKLQMTLSLLSSLYVIFIFMIPESPRWLLATGQNEEAIKILENISTKNGRDGSMVRRTINNQYKTKKKNENKVTFKNILQSKNMRLKTIIVCLEWLICGMCFFAFSQHVGMVGKDIFLTVTTSGLIVIPGVLLCIPSIRHIGCRSTVIMSQLLTAVCFFLITTIPKGVYSHDWPRVLISGFGVFGFSVSIPTLTLYTGELYPTVVRNAGVGCATMFSRIGSMISPFIICLESISESFPFILLSTLTLAQTAFLYLLPETKGCPLPDTIEEAENFGRANNRRLMEYFHQTKPAGYRAFGKTISDTQQKDNLQNKVENSHQCVNISGGTK